VAAAAGAVKPPCRTAIHFYRHSRPVLGRSKKAADGKHFDYGGIWHVFQWVDPFSRVLARAVSAREVNSQCFFRIASLYVIG